MKRALAIVIGIALAGVGTVALAGRSTSGTYSLPSGNPVVTGTSISTTWANNTLGDLAQGVSDSLDRNGRGGMLSALRGVDGTVSAPAWSWTNETGSGAWRNGLNDIRFSVNGVAKSGWNTSGFGLLDTGSAFRVNLAAPSLAASYTMTVPAAVPASTLPVSMSSAGALSTGQIATAQIADANVTPAKLSAVTSGSTIATKEYADARFVCAGYVRGSDAATLAQVGSWSVSRSSAGVYSVTVSGITTSAIVLVSLHVTASYAVSYQLGAGSFTVYTWNTATGAATDANFSFEVVKL